MAKSSLCLESYRAGRGAACDTAEYERIYTLWVTLPTYVGIVYPWFVPAHEAAS